MIELALYLKRTGYRPRQVQDFIPGPMDSPVLHHGGARQRLGSDHPVVAEPGPNGATVARQALDLSCAQCPSPVGISAQVSRN